MNLDFLLVDPVFRSLRGKSLRELLEVLGKDCDITYNDMKAQCNNCFHDTINGCSTNVPTPHAKMYFERGGGCPKCLGTGFTTVAESPCTLRMILVWDSTLWIKLPETRCLHQSRLPNICQAIGFWSECQFLFNVHYITVPSNLVGNVKLKMGPLGGTERHGSTNKFYVKLLERIY